MFVLSGIRAVFNNTLICRFFPILPLRQRPCLNKGFLGSCSFQQWLKVIPQLKQKDDWDNFYQPVYSCLEVAL